MAAKLNRPLTLALSAARTSVSCRPTLARLHRPTLLVQIPCLSYYATGPSPPPPRPQLPYQGQNITRPVWDTLRRVGVFFRITTLTTLTILVIGFGVYESVHAYVENVAIAADDLPPGEDYDFSLERARWTGLRSRGGAGTDPRLGWFGRHYVRSAWGALAWGTGADEMFVDERGHMDVNMRGFEVPLREYALARAHLGFSLGIAQKRKIEFPGSDTAMDLLSRYAEVLELIGGHRFLLEAKAQYEDVLRGLVTQGRREEAAKVGMKIGDLGRRLGEDGSPWWVWAVRAANGGRLDLVEEEEDGTQKEVVVGPVDVEDAKPEPQPKSKGWFSRTPATPSTPLPTPPPDLSTPPPPSFIPSTLSSSPLGQRTTLAALLSLSAQYAATSQLSSALEVQRAGLALVDPLLSSEAPQPTSAAGTLHFAHLQHQAALLQIHTAETLYALPPSLRHPAPDPETTPVAHLLASARSSEQIVSTLLSIPTDHPEFLASPLLASPPSAKKDLATRFVSSPTLRPPAERLLRDSRRAAAQAWSLAGLLYEREGDVGRAYECADRGMAWVGLEDVGKDGVGLEGEKRVVWERWRRVREKALEQSRAAKEQGR